MGPKTDRRHQQGEESRERILDAVIQIAAERGYEGTTVSLVSERSGLPVSSIYWHFGNKDDLIAAVIERGYQAWAAELDQPLDVADDASRREVIAAILRHDVGSLAERHPEFLRFGLMLTLEQRAEEAKGRTRFLDARQASLERIVGGLAVVLESERIPDDGFARQLAQFIMATVDGLYLASRATPSTLELDAHLDLLAAAIDLLLDERIRR